DGLPLPITAARGSFVDSKIFRLNYDFAWKPSLLLHLGAGYQQNNVYDDAPVLNYNAMQQLKLSGAEANRTFPQFSGLLAPGNAGGMVNMGPGQQSHSIEEKPAFSASVTQLHSNHAYKLGAEFRTEGYPASLYTNLSGAYLFAPSQTGLPSLQ